MNIINAFIELDRLNESFDDRQELISKLKALGKNYYFDKYSDKQLYCMLEKAEEEKTRQDALLSARTENNKSTCPTCDTELTDGEFCPNCDDGRNDLVYEEFEASDKTKSTYVCDECGFEVDMYDDEFDGCCPNCHDHHGGFGRCEEGFKDLFNRKKDKVEPVGYWEEPTTEVSNKHAVNSVVDSIKAGYEAGYFDKMPIGRENAATANLNGPDKERLVAYFKKQPEFSYEMNTEQGIISHEFISDTLDIEIFDSFMQVYRIPQNESLHKNNKSNKEKYEMNFQTILEELDRLYEEDVRRVTEKETDELCSVDFDGQQMFTGTKEECEDWIAKHPDPKSKNGSRMTIKNSANINVAEALKEDTDEEILIDDEPIIEDEAVEMSADATEEVPKQLVLECAKCGALVIKDEADVNVDEETDLANVEEECQYCEETEGYKIVGALAPYDGAVVAEEPEEEVTEALLEGKITDSIKKIGTRLGADAATCVRSFAELISDLIKNDTLYDAAEYVENKAVLKALESGNETVLNTCTKEDIEELKQDIEEYKKAKANKKAGKASDKEDLEELLDVDLDVPVTIKADNNEVAVGGATV